MFTYYPWFKRRRQWHPTPVLLLGKSHGWRSLVGCSPWVAKSQTWLNDFTFTFHFHALEKEMATHSSVLAWRIPGMGKPGGLPSMGSHRVGHDWSDLAAWFKVKLEAFRDLTPIHPSLPLPWLQLPQTTSDFCKIPCSYPFRSWHMHRLSPHPRAAAPPAQRIPQISRCGRSIRAPREDFPGSQVV